MVALTIRFPDQAAAAAWFAEARSAGQFPADSGVRPADSLDLPYRVPVGSLIVTREPSVPDWLIPPGGGQSRAAELGLDDDRCRHCGQRHDRVPDDLCEAARAEYDAVENDAVMALLTAAGAAPEGGEQE